jgi:hypothetical protein
MKRPAHSIAALAALLALPLGTVMAAEAPAASPAPARAAPEARHKEPAPCDVTSTRIRRNRNGDCPASSQPTRSYTKDDLDSTGQTDVGEALRRLDPRFH